MPVQVVYSINQKKVIPLILGGEGLEDIIFLPLSLTQFTLTAEILGGNPIGHVFEWELIQDDNPTTPPETNPLTIDNFGSSIVLDKSHGNQTDRLFPDRQVWVYNSSDSSNDGAYIITSSTFVEGGSPLGSPLPPSGSPQVGRTILEVTPPIPNPNAVTPGLLRTQLGADVYVTQPAYDITGATPPPWPWIMAGASTTDFTLNFLYAPSGVAYFKRWRIWVDKGTPIEDFEDVDIFPFPLDDIYTPSKASTLAHKDTTLGSSYDCRALGTSQIRLGPDVFGKSDFAECPPTSLVVDWDLPSCDGDKIVGWTIEDLQNAKWQFEANLPATPRRYGPYGIGEIKRIIAHYEQGDTFNYSWSQESIPVKLDGETMGVGDIVSQPSECSSINHVGIPSYNVTLIEAAEKILPDDFVMTGEEPLSSISHVSIPTFNVTLIEAAEIEIPDDFVMTSEEPLSSINHVDAPTYNVTLISGGGSG